MAKGVTRTERKQEYFDKLAALIDEYTKCFIVHVDNVSSFQMQGIRSALRGKAVIIMGKNTMMRKVIRAKLSTRPSLEKLMLLIRGNVGLVFTKHDMSEIKDIIIGQKTPAPARAGAIAPVDVVVPAQITSLGPEQTSFMQALNITTKITRGNIEIMADVHLIEAGRKVTASEASLLQKLNVMPFFYGMEVLQVFDNGAVYAASVLDLTDDDLMKSFMSGISNIAALGLQVNYPTLASVPHSLVNGFKNVLGLGLAVDYEMKELETIKAYLENPEAFAVAAPVEEKKEAVEEKKEEEEESDDDMGFGLFD